MPETPADPAGRLRAVGGFVLDMDGTLVLGDRENRGLRPLPGAVDLLAALDARGTPYCVFTNGTVKTPLQCARALQDAGFAIADDAVLTPASSGARVFLDRGHRRVMVLGGAGITGPLEEAGIEVVPPHHGERADAVFAGWFRQDFTFEALEAACEAVSAGAAFYSASQSPYFATVEGRSLGSSRAIAAVVHDITGAPVCVVGKPAPISLEVAAAHLGRRPSDLAVVGDDPDLEVPMAHSGGALAVAVHTGIGRPGAFDDLPVDARPHLEVPDLRDVTALLATV